MVIGLALFVLWPFTRLVHAFSAPIGYLFRPYVVYRSRDVAAKHHLANFKMIVRHGKCEPDTEATLSGAGESRPAVRRDGFLLTGSGDGLDGRTHDGGVGLICASWVGAATRHTIPAAVIAEPTRPGSGSIQDRRTPGFRLP